jgi:cellulose synthase/poly-beta-1,6-N-acetylglucosamine synthase-like glycosyltransferase
MTVSTRPRSPDLEPERAETPPRTVRAPAVSPLGTIALDGALIFGGVLHAIAWTVVASRSSRPRIAGAAWLAAGLGLATSALRTRGAARSWTRANDALPDPAAPTSRLRVSVVIPVRDDAVALRRCLAALAAQTVPPAEIVVVDNGSRDDGAAVARAHGARVVREPRPGIPAAAGTGYDAVTGDVIARLDADSVPSPEWIERIVTVLGSPSGPAGVTGPGRFSDLRPSARTLAHRLYMRAYFVVMHRALGRVPLFGSNFALRTSAWQRARHRFRTDDPELHDDLHLSRALDAVDVVRHDDRLRVTISSRPLRSPRGMVRRVARGIRTLRT